MSAFTKNQLSGSTYGAPIKVHATATPGTLIHTATASITTVFDEIWLWVMNTTTAAQSITIEWTGATVPDDNIVLNIPARSGLVLAIPGLIMQNGLTVKAFCATADILHVVGFVNQITN